MISPTDQFGDFMSQLPTGLFATVCVAGLLLFGAFTWFAYFKPQMKRRQQASATGDTNSEDLPDIMSLLNNMEDVPTQRQAAPASIQPGIYSVQLQSGETVEARQIVSILRDPRDERLIVHMEDMGYRTLANAPEVRKQFVKIMQELSQVITEPDEDLPVANAPAPEPVVPEPKPEVVKPKRTAPPPPVGSDGKMPGDLPTYKLEDSVVPTSSGKYQSVPMPELDIAASIEAYLQHKLNHTPEYNGREIHVHSAPGGGVRIQVDNSYFDAVSDVTDADIRSFLAETIEEWQERQ